MGAGAQRWWEPPGPFAVAVSCDWNPTKSHEGYARLVIGGVDCGSAVSDLVEAWARDINAAQGQRVLSLEAEIEQLRRHAVAVDKALDGAKVLEALSDETLLTEFNRRDLLGRWALRPPEADEGPIDVAVVGGGFDPAEIDENIENLREYVSSFTFALAEHDAAHQEHFRRQALAWANNLRRSLQPKGHQ